MPILACSARNCSYNRDDRCCLAAIRVGEEGASRAAHTCCESFISTEFTNSNEVHHPCMDVAIQCTAAGCIYNDNRSATCTASQVRVGNTISCCSEDTDCLTFECR